MYSYCYCNVNAILFNQCDRESKNITGFSLLTGLCLPLIIFYRVSLLRSTKKKVTGILLILVVSQPRGWSFLGQLRAFYEGCLDATLDWFAGGGFHVMAFSAHAESKRIAGSSAQSPRITCDQSDLCGDLCGFFGVSV